MVVPFWGSFEECLQALVEIFGTVSAAKIFEISTDRCKPGRAYESFGVIVARRRGIRQLGKLPGLGKKIY
jgi:hypothetical protein